MSIEHELAGIEATIGGADAPTPIEALKEAKDALQDIAGRVGDDPKLQARCSQVYMELTKRFEAESHLLAYAEAASTGALTAAAKAGDKKLLTRASVVRAQHLLTIGDRREALECLVDIAEKVDDTTVELPWLAKLWQTMGQGWFGLEQFGDEARRSFERAAEIALASGTSRVEPLLMLGASELLLGQTDTSRKTLERAAALAEEESPGAPLLAKIHWWRGVCALRSGAKDEAEAHMKAVRQVAESSGDERALMLAQALDGLIQVHFVDVTSGVAALVAVQQRVNSLWPPMREPLLALRDAAEMKGLEQVRKAYVEHNDSEHKRDAGLQNFARGVTAALSDELMSLLETQGEILADKAERESAQVISVLMENTTITELREDSSGEHPYRVGALAAHLARRLGKETAFCRTIEIAAALHDVGKTGLPDSLVLKRGRLEPHQREAMKEHAETGWRLLSEQKLEHPVLTMGAVIAKHHHEHWDGNGYPSGLIGDAIPIEARICGLAEVFDALTHKRPWRAAQSVDKALLVIESLRGYQFDPSLTDAFVAMVRQLVEEHGSGLDTYLGQKAQKSALLTTRKALLERSREGMDESESSLA